LERGKITEGEESSRNKKRPQVRGKKRGGRKKCTICADRLVHHHDSRIRNTLLGGGELRRKNNKEREKGSRIRG